jgi:hypothetical protein
MRRLWKEIQDGGWIYLLNGLTLAAVIAVAGWIGVHVARGCM